MLLYSITRGIIEVWRGDLVRGFVIPGVLSTSQFIGVLTALASLAMLFYLSRRSRAEKPETSSGFWILRFWIRAPIERLS